MHRHREQTCGFQGAGVGDSWIGSLGLADAKYTEWLNKVLLCSTGNCIQYLFINHNGKEKIFNTKWTNNLKFTKNDLIPDFRQWASLVAQMVKNLPETQETWIWPLGQEEPLEKKMATRSQYSCLENCMFRGAGLQSMGSQRVRNDRVTNALNNDFNVRQQNWRITMKNKIDFHLFRGLICV